MNKVFTLIFMIKLNRQYRTPSGMLEMPKSFQFLSARLCTTSSADVNFFLSIDSLAVIVLAS